MYIWERSGWPDFRWDAQRLLPRLADARFRQGRFLGTMASLGFGVRVEAELNATAEEVIETSAIEGERLDAANVRSSIARRLGLPEGGRVAPDRKVDGVVDMLLDATRNHARPLTAERIFGWHAALFPTGWSGTERIDVGAWRSDREGPMQVVSGVYGRPVVHFEAPPAARVPAEMERFLRWFERNEGDGILRAGLAHLWFVTIHPLEDGNGRIARAIADLAIARTEGTGQRFYSVSSRIESERKTYYEVVERAQKGDLDVTEWLSWFLRCYVGAVDAAESAAGRVIARAAFWQAHAGEPPFSERQRKVLNRLLEGFEGFVTAKKWAALCKCSPDTAQRDIADLVRRGLLARNAGGSKKTSYRFTWGGA